MILKKSKGTTTEILYAIRWNQLKNGYPFPMDNQFTKLGFEDVTRTTKFSGSNHKEPFTSDMIRELIGLREDDVSNILTITQPAITC